MKNKLAGWIIGGLITASALGLAFGANSLVSAAANTEQAAAPAGMMMPSGQMEKMGPEMMNSPEMQKQCEDMMKSTDMQQAMKGMMQQPQMQTMMKQMMASDPAFKQMIEDMVKDSNSSGEQAAQLQATESTNIDHNAHHAAQ
ncbi:hypothetical protein [Sporomusa acidovorans]|uniref:hypothetical protein n=1 Tax=Sporomusa acidovorans TaxID=112900 RepID=UPI000886890D|nr:hypothetical protein [Sporomusa acidovorans]OZC19053.1 hypothetical protein SPACI_31390 [Sporomusa acidovorans DSM 3132]SDD74329.1 hypothetical protein SAMN04488499_1003228 [Sporomusa acidovorans]